MGTEHPRPAETPVPRFPSDERVVVRGDALVHEVEASDETVLFSEERGELMLLNDLGAGIWYLVDGRRSVSEIVALVSEQFPEQESARIHADVAQFLEQLEKVGAVHFELSPPRGGGRDDHSL